MNFVRSIIYHIQVKMLFESTHIQPGLSTSFKHVHSITFYTVYVVIQCCKPKEEGGLLGGKKRQKNYRGLNNYIFPTFSVRSFLKHCLHLCVFKYK